VTQKKRHPFIDSNYCISETQRWADDNGQP